MNLGGEPEKSALEQYGVDLTAKPSPENSTQSLEEMQKSIEQSRFFRDERKTTPSPSAPPVPEKPPF